MNEINKSLGSRRKTYHQSNKSGRVYCDSSYELKAALLLDEDSDVLFYENQLVYQGSIRTRRLDFLVHLKDGTKKLIEVKPQRRIVQFEEQIEDAKKYALDKGYEFEIWTEKELGFGSEYQATKWADEYLSTIKPVDFVAIRKELDRKKAIKHYNKHIAQDTVEVYCEFCKETHNPLRLTYEKNIERNGAYICEKHGGFIAGSKPKKKKENPYAIDGKKLCNECEEIKLFEHFGIDKDKEDGYATRCKECRAKKAKNNYKEKQIYGLGKL